MDLLKNFIYAGVGFASSTSDKLKETIDDLVEKGKISDTEGRKICDDFFKSTGEKKEEFESKLKKVQDDLTERFDFMKKDKNGIEALNKRIEDLEAKVIAAEKKATKAAATVKKTVTKAAKK